MIIKFLLILLITYIYSEQITFGFSLDKKQQLCLSDYFTKQTTFIYRIVSEENSVFTVDIKAPDGRIIYHMTDQINIQFSNIAELNGYYQVCVENNKNSNIIPIYYLLRTGVSVKDYSSVAKTKDLEPMNLAFQQITEMINYIKHYRKRIDKYMRSSQKYYKKLSHNTILYSIIMMGAMIFIGITETVYMKKYMERRKLI